MTNQTPEAHLAAALDKVDNACGQPDCLMHIDEALAHEDGYQRIAHNLLAALPDDTHLFTVDSLAAAVFAADDPHFRFATRGNCERFAAAIIKAAKEASDAP